MPIWISSCSVAVGQCCNSLPIQAQQQKLLNLTDLSAGVYYLRVFATESTNNAYYTLSLQAQKNAKTDLLWRNYTTGENILWTMNGTTQVATNYLTTVADGHWQLAEAADFTGDGQVDLVWRNNTADETRVWQMQGTSLVSTLALPPVADLNWQLVGSGDFNRDGQTDLVWRNQSTGENVVWHMQGTTVPSGSLVYFTPVTDLNWRIEGVADFNGDDHPDLIWRNYASGQDIIWLMNGTTLSALAPY